MVRNLCITKKWQKILKFQEKKSEEISRKNIQIFLHKSPLLVIKISKVKKGASHFLTCIQKSKKKIGKCKNNSKPLTWQLDCCLITEAIKKLLIESFFYTYWCICHRQSKHRNVLQIDTYKSWIRNEYLNCLRGRVRGVFQKNRIEIPSSDLIISTGAEYLIRMSRPADILTPHALR